MRRYRNKKNILPIFEQKNKPPMQPQFTLPPEQQIRLMKKRIEILAEFQKILKIQTKSYDIGIRAQAQRDLQKNKKTLFHFYIAYSILRDKPLSNAITLTQTDKWRILNLKLNEDFVYIEKFNHQWVNTILINCFSKKRVYFGAF